MEKMCLHYILSDGNEAVQMEGTQSESTGFRTFYKGVASFCRLVLSAVLFYYWNGETKYTCKHITTQANKHFNIWWYRTFYLRHKIYCNSYNSKLLSMKRPFIESKLQKWLVMLMMTALLSTAYCGGLFVHFCLNRGGGLVLLFVLFLGSKPCRCSANPLLWTKQSSVFVYDRNI